MFKIIGIIFVLFAGWIILNMLLVRLFPEYGLKKAEARYDRSPDEVNERLLWEARSRVKNK